MFCFGEGKKERKEFVGNRLRAASIDMSDGASRRPTAAKRTSRDHLGPHLASPNRVLVEGLYEVQHPTPLRAAPALRFCFAI